MGPGPPRLAPRMLVHVDEVPGSDLRHPHRGVDLVFPHHQNEIARSEGATGQTLSRYWMPYEFINIESVKLSKSLGNQLPLRDLAGLVDDARSEEVVPGFRYFVVTNHYRTTLNFTEEALEGAIRARRRLNRLHRRLRSTAGDAELGRLVKEREAARRARDWDRADALRADLEAAGVVTDTPDGPLWTRKRP